MASKHLLLLMAAAVLSHLILADARAQTDAMRLNSTRGALFVDRHSAELIFNGQRHAIAIRGSRLHETVRADRPFVGIADKLRSPIDIVCTYVIASPAAPAVSETTTKLLQHQGGVVSRFDIKPAASETIPNLDGLTISMQ